MILGEILLVTGVSGTTWTVTRGVEGTQPVTCLAGTVVDHILTAGALDQIKADLVSIGTYANLPTPGTNRVGDLYIPTDSFYDLIRYNGTSWDHFRNGRLLIPPVNSAFTWANQANGTVTGAYGGVVGISQDAIGGQMQIRYMTAPATPYTITTGFLAHYWQYNYSSVGIGWRSSSGQFATGNVGWNNGWVFRPYKWNSAISYNSDYGQIPIPPAMVHGPIIWLQMFDNGTNRGWNFSSNGTNWTNIRTDSRTDFCSPDNVMFCWGDLSAQVGITLLHWSVT
jgi:hypothetical protein